MSQYESRQIKNQHPKGCFFHARKEKIVEGEVKEILLDKLKEMSEVTYDCCEDMQGYAILCSAMGDIAKVILEN